MAQGEENIKIKNVTLNPGLPWQKQHSTGRRLFFHQKVELKLEEQTSTVHNFVWC
jgi:hypothetical protein